MCNLTQVVLHPTPPPQVVYLHPSNLLLLQVHTHKWEAQIERPAANMQRKWGEKVQRKEINKRYRRRGYTRKGCMYMYTRSGYKRKWGTQGWVTHSDQVIYRGGRIRDIHRKVEVQVHADEKVNIEERFTKRQGTYWAEIHIEGRKGNYTQAEKGRKRR